MVGFIFDQEIDRDANYCGQIQPLQEIERRSDLDLFPKALPSWGSQELGSDLGC